MYRSIGLVNEIDTEIEYLHEFVTVANSDL